MINAATQITRHLPITATESQSVFDQFQDINVELQGFVIYELSKIRKSPPTYYLRAAYQMIYKRPNIVLRYRHEGIEGPSIVIPILHDDKFGVELSKVKTLVKA